MQPTSLEECRFRGTDLYRVTHLIRFVEGNTAQQAGSRFTSLKSKCAQDGIHFDKQGTVLCIPERDLRKFVSKLKDTANKTLVIGARPGDETKVREVVLHAGDKEVRLEVDYESQRLPLIETVQLFGFSQNAAELAVIAIKARDAEIAEMIGKPMRINGVGHERLCADLNVVIIVLMQLPSTARVRTYRRKCADDLVRQMKGDLTLVDQIARNHSVLQHTGGIHLYETQVCESSQGISNTQYTEGSTPKAELVVSRKSTLLVDIVKCLSSVLGSSLMDATQHWIDACLRSPIDTSWKCYVDYTNTAFAPRDTILRVSQLLSDNKREALIEYIDCNECEVTAKHHGFFYPTMAWTPPHETPKLKVVWVQMHKNHAGNLCVDVDDLMCKTYDLQKRRAVSCRTQYIRCLADNEVHKVSTQRKTLYLISPFSAAKLTGKVTAKKDAEAERMYEHSLAQMYIREGLCGVRVKCNVCGCFSNITVAGKRVLEQPWNEYKLDVGIVFGGDVVGAIEVRNTSVISDKKYNELMTSELQWAEVDARDVLAQVRDKCTNVSALRGGGVCAECGHTKTRTALLLNIAELEENHSRAMKRKIDADAEVGALEQDIKRARERLKRLI